MKKFIAATVKPVLIIGGGITALAGLNAFLPRFAVENIQNMAFIPEYTIFVQHWGMMVSLIGVFMVIAAFRESWRTPIILYAMIEKAFMVYLAVVNLGQPYAEGFYAPATMDAILTLWSILYVVNLYRTDQGDSATT